MLAATKNFLDTLAKHAPTVHADLAPPATEPSLAELEARTGPLPGSLRSLLLTHDGQTSEECTFVPFYTFASLNHASGFIEQWEELAEDLEDPDIWQSTWVPFAFFDGDLLCVCTASGFVFHYRVHGGATHVIATSFEHFLELAATDMERGAVTESDGAMVVVDESARADWLEEPFEG